MVVAIASLNDQNSLENQANSVGWPQKILTAIKSAANKTGVDFSYLVKQAAQESSFEPRAKSTTSSATGLYQFTSQTWLTMVKQNGAKYGLQTYADHITADSLGSLKVSDPAWKHAILNLRNDPTVSSEMAAELGKQNKQSLQTDVGGKIGGTEMYLAHFLGAGGASDFLNEMRKNPNASAANLLPEAASANPSVFYGSNGQAKTLGQIYNHFAQKFDGSATIQLASLPTSTRAMAQTAGVSSDVPSMMSPASAASAYSGAPFSGNSTSTGTSSLVATMIMAQANIGAVDLSSLIKLPDETRRNDENKRASLYLS